MSRRRFLCLDCKVDTGKIYEHYFIHTEIWLSVVPTTSGMLCIGCLEDRLNRQLDPSDFPLVTINSAKYSSMSTRLRNRIYG
jgi:hypothetical protein